MLRFIRELFRGESLLDQAFEATANMLALARDMVQAASDSLRRSDTADVELDIRKADVTINKYQRETRRQVLTHMAVSSAADFAPALVLTSIVIDVERLGDYAKNITELAQAHPSALKAFNYEKIVQDLENRVTQGFNRVGEAFKESDAAQASALMATHREFSQLADGILESLIKGEDTLDKGDAVTLALYVRYLKRTEAHLNNIVSSVVNPFPRIGYGRQKRPGEGPPVNDPPA
jgi:phosphate uptake regulator